MSESCKIEGTEYWIMRGEKHRAPGWYLGYKRKDQDGMINLPFLLYLWDEYNRKAKSEPSREFKSRCDCWWCWLVGSVGDNGL